MSAAIVVGTDGSETAYKAVARAAWLASKAGATLHIVTAVDTTAAAVPEGVDSPHTSGEQADIVLRQAVEHVSEDESVAADLAIETHQRGGDPANVLIELAIELGAGVIVVGNKGMTGIARFLLGSVPNKLVHHAPCDVLIVRTN